MSAICSRPKPGIKWLQIWVMKTPSLMLPSVIKMVTGCQWILNRQPSGMKNQQTAEMFPRWHLWPQPMMTASASPKMIRRPAAGMKKPLLKAIQSLSSSLPPVMKRAPDFCAILVKLFSFTHSLPKNHIVKPAIVWPDYMIKGSAQTKIRQKPQNGICGRHLPAMARPRQ